MADLTELNLAEARDGLTKNSRGELTEAHMAVSASCAQCLC